MDVNIRYETCHTNTPTLNKFHTKIPQQNLELRPSLPVIFEEQKQLTNPYVRTSMQHVVGTYQTGSSQDYYPITNRENNNNYLVYSNNPNNYHQALVKLHQPQQQPLQTHLQQQLQKQPQQSHQQPIPRTPVHLVQRNKMNINSMPDACFVMQQNMHTTSIQQFPDGLPRQNSVPQLPYSSSPQQQRISSNSSSPANTNSYIQRYNSDPCIQQSLALPAKDVLGSSPGVYQQQPQLRQQQQQRYSSSPTGTSSYYPYHRDILNGDVRYSVRMPSGIIHQYPAPDYTSLPPDYPTPPPNCSALPRDYLTASHNINTLQTRSNKQLVNSAVSYVGNVNNGYYSTNQNIQQQSTSCQQVLQKAYQSSNQQQPGIPPNQYSQMLSGIAVKQDPKYDIQSPAVQPQSSSIGYSGYRAPAVVDSPQGSPLPLQTSPGVYKAAQIVTDKPPPVHQKQYTPASQVSNEVYSLDSPSSQLLLQDMSLNSPHSGVDTYGSSPRPRAETFDMEPLPPPVPPRSPAPRYIEIHEVSPQVTPQTVTNLQQQQQQQQQQSKSMPPPSQPPPQYQTQQPQQQHVDRRLRSGTVEMTDSAPVNNQTLQQKEILPPQTRYSINVSDPLRGRANSFNTPPDQRGRAGTIEMVDTVYNPNDNGQGSNLPEQRIRSGTVEMSEVASNQQPYYPSAPYQSQSYKALSPVSATVPTSVYSDRASQKLAQYLPNNNINEKDPVPSDIYSVQPPTSQLPSQYSSSSITPIDSPVQVSLQQYVLQQQSTVLTTSKQQPAQIIYSQQQQTNQTGAVQQQQSALPPQVNQMTSPAYYQVLSPLLSIPSPQNYNIADSTQQGKENVLPPLQQIKNNDIRYSNNSSEIQLPTQQEIPKIVRSEYLSQYNNSDCSTRKYNVGVKQGLSDANNNNNNNFTGNHLSDQELEQQQKIMQQQYIQRVRQAELQQQLREIQSEYEANLQLEQDIAQEFLWEQKGVIEQKPSRYQQQQQQPVVQHLNYQDQSSNIPYILPQQQQQQLPPRLPYLNKDDYPIPNMPPHSVYQQHQRVPLHMPPQQQRSVPSQPIVIMPGGGSFSNPGQFVSPANIPLPRKEQVSSEVPNPAMQRNQGKQTPFQRLRKIAEDISSFVDDVVKFKGKKGDREYKYLEEMLTKQLLLLDKVPANKSDELRNARKALVKEVQELLEILERRSTQQGK